MHQNCWGLTALIVLSISSKSYCSLSLITIGAIFDSNNRNNESSQMLQYAVDEANDKILKNSGIKLSVETETVMQGHEYVVSKRVCNLLEVMTMLGAGVIFGPKSPSAAFHAINICDAKEIPYINTYLDEDAESKLAVLNMYPSQESLIQLLVDVVNASEWKSVTILYESSLWLTRISKILEINNKMGNRIRVTNLDYTIENEFIPALQRVRDSDDRNIILDCSIEPLPKILKQAMQVGLMTKHYRWIITNLDTHTLDLEPLKYGGTNITTFRILNMNHPLMKVEDDDADDVNYDERSNDNTNQNNRDVTYGYEFSNALDDIYSLSCDPNASPDSFVPSYPEKINNTLSIRSSLLYDSIMVFAITLRQLGREQVETSQIMCSDSSSTWNKGFTILNYMKNTKYDGLTGKIEFDTSGIRSNITIEVLELGPNGLDTIGVWKYASEYPPKGLMVTRPFSESSKGNDDEDSIKNKTLTVVTALSEPYTMLKDSADLLSGNNRFEGFAIDLIFELSLLLEFSYTFVLEEDNNYGVCLNNITNEWNGMINEVMSGRADLAITDLTVTSERIKALDFTPSIMNLGIAILYQVPKKKAPSTFSFMSPFANDVWIILGVTYLLISFCFFCLGRISPSQWENPYPCIEEPIFLENQFSLQNSLWFAAGALLQQGSEIEVKAASIRLASAVWWFFTLIIVSSYTANLAAFLVVENRVTIIESVEDFKECGLPGMPKCKAIFGAKKGGSTFNFFRDSKYPTFVNMYNVMKNNPDVLVEENHEGLRRAQNENYAYLMESTSLLYFTERICNVTMVGHLIDDRNYAIGMKKGYKYYNALSEGVLQLQERGVLDKLHTKWWKAKRGGGACSKKESSEAEGLKMENLEGVFLVLTYGSVFAFMYGIIQSILIIRKRARDAKISFRKEMKIESKFLILSLINPDKTKPVRFWNKVSTSMHSSATDRSNPSNLIQ